MSLLQRVERAQRAAASPESAPVAPDAEIVRVEPPHPKAASSPAREALLGDIRRRVQDEVIASFKSLIDAPDAEQVRSRIAAMVDRIILDGAFSVTRDERHSLVEEIVHEITGFGPIEPYLADETITEVMVNGPRHVYIERSGKIEQVDAVFLNDEHVLRIIDRIIAPMGRHIDETSPRVDARLPDGSRVNAVIAPISQIGPVITVRKFAHRPYTVEDLIRFGTATAEMFDFLRACIEARLNVFVSGGTGSGKTTTLNVISQFIPEDDRIITIEDAAELQLRQEHVVTLEARPPNIEGAGEITIRDLLRNALHMRPDRIIVGECRSGEALDMIQAMTTGQAGSLSTGHANTTRDMLRRLETMVLMTGYELPLRAIREQIASAVDLIVHTARLKDGSRKIVNITEVFGIEDDEILTQDIFAFEQTDFRDGKVIGELRPTGVRPTFMSVFKSSGVEMPKGEFGIPPEDPAKPTRAGKGRWMDGTSSLALAATKPGFGLGKVVNAGGMLYVSAIGPVNPETGLVVNGGIKEQSRQCLANLKARLEASGSSLDKVAWANWALREPSEFDLFNEEWLRWFPSDGPVGQGTLLPPSHRRAGFRVSLGVIAEA
ncbi:MAG: Flp pilus assembly complex ATPase component TadA [Chloroflexi bacterium]|nr:Flp pilus assembly complex ATPase component TadA [Chloroflexota bacterium]